MEAHNIGRRQTLKYLGLLTGSAAGREFLGRWLTTAAAEIPAGAGHHVHGQPPADSSSGADSEYTPRFFKPDEFKTVEMLTEIIIPSDDTPGAKEAQVARYIDVVVFSAAEFRSSLQVEWKKGLEALDGLSRERHQHAFDELTAKDQELLLEAMSLPERKTGASHPGFEFYRLVKEMTLEGFYTSRIGLIDVLGYKGLSVMSEFPGCTHPEHQA